MHKDGFKGVGSLEDGFYVGMLKGSFQFLTEMRNIEYRDDNIFLDFYAMIAFMMGV